jgi:FkbM family methyltransferase
MSYPAGGTVVLGVGQMPAQMSISDRINAFYDSGCSDPAMLTFLEAEPYREKVKWVDAVFEKAEMHEADYAVFGHFRDPATAVLDVGANYGYSVSSMCAAGCLASVLSIEALPWYRDHLARVRARDPKRFDFRVTGVGQAPAALRFVTPVINGVIASALTSADETTHRQHLFRNVEATLAERGIAATDLALKFIITTQSVTTLDRIVAGYDGRLDLRQIVAIKIDVEGQEGAVLAGARALLAEHRPLIMSEGANRPPEVRAVMAEADYAFACRDGTQLRLDEEISMEANGYFLHRSRLAAYAASGLLRGPPRC